ncbi:MAG TPA: flagellar assembly protein FliW [Fimbriimonadales bacterium]|nr:flagellar assembly protein FliW [Fimbriimonadales bacterium]
MKIPTTRFGEIKVEEKQIIDIPGGLVGFPQCERFVLLEHLKESPYRWLQSVDEPSVAFLVINPSSIVKDYAIRLNPEVAESLYLSEETLKMVLAIVSVPLGKSKEATVNLVAPIVVNSEKRLGKQLILEDTDWSIHHRIYGTSEEVRSVEEKAA